MKEILVELVALLRQVLEPQRRGRGRREGEGAGGGGARAGSHSHQTKKEYLHIIDTAEE